MNRRWLISCITFFLAGLVALPVFAESPIDKEAALADDFDALITNAQQAFGERNFEAAIEYLVISNRLEPDPRLFLNIARSYEELGDCRSSLAYYRAFLHDPPDDQALIERAESALEEQRPLCREFRGDLGGRLRFDTNPALARVYINDELLGLSPTETAGLPVGTYTIRFELEGYDDHVEEVEIVTEEPAMVRVTLQEESDEVEEIVEAPPEVEEAPDGFSLNPIAVGIAGVGAAGLLTGAVLDGLVLASIDDERREIRNGESDHENPTQRLQDLEDRRGTVRTGAIIGYVGGGLLLAAGAGWITYDYLTAGDDNSSAYGWQISPQIGTESAGFSLFRRF